MKRFTTSLSRLAMVGFVGLLATACSHENQSTPPSTAPAPALPQQQGSTEQQVGSPANEPGATNQTEQAQPGQTPPATGSSGSSAPSQPEPQEPQEQGPGMQSGQGGQQGTANAQPGGEPTAPPEASSLDDSQVAAVLDAINADSIRQAQLAGNSASTPQVRQYARRVLVVHQSLQNQLNTLYQQTGITPSPNAISNQIQSDGQNQVTALQSLRGKDFDRVYMDDQVQSLNSSLALLDRTMPTVQNPHLKAELVVARGEVGSHLKQAEKIQQQLQQGSTSGHAGGASSRRGSMNVSPEGDGAMMR